MQRENLFGNFCNTELLTGDKNKSWEPWRHIHAQRIETQNIILHMYKRILAHTFLLAVYI